MNNNIQFILFGDIMTGDNVWYHDKYNNKINFINKLKQYGEIIILKPNYINFMKYSNKNTGANWFYKTNYKKTKFNIEDLYFENYTKWIYNQIDKNKKYIAIGLDQGCHFSKYFCNQYSNNCIALYILIDRNFTKYSYEKTFHSEMNYNFIKNIIGNKYKKYIIENLTNKRIHKLLKKIKKLKDNEKYIQLLNGLCKGIIRSQYDKITKMNVKTIIYSDSKTLTPEKLQENKDFNKKSNNKIIYYYINDNSEYLIHGKYADEILNNIYELIKKKNNFIINLIDSLKLTKIKDIQCGLNGCVYLVENLDKKQLIFKLEKMDVYDKSQPLTSEYFRQIDFDKQIAKKYPNKFMTLIKYDIIKNCNFRHPVENNLDYKRNERFIRKQSQPNCFYLLYKPVLDGTYKDIKEEIINSEELLLDFLIQIIESINIYRKKGFIHTDVNITNIMYKKYKSTNYNWYIIDYGNITNIKYPDSILDKERIDNDTDYKIYLVSDILSIIEKFCITSNIRDHKINYTLKNNYKIINLFDDDSNDKIIKYIPINEFCKNLILRYKTIIFKILYPKKYADYYNIEYDNKKQLLKDKLLLCINHSNDDNYDNLLSLLKN